MKKSVREISEKKTCVGESPGRQACNFIQKRLQHMRFPVKFAKLLRKTFFTEHLRWLLLQSNC